MNYTLYGDGIHDDTGAIQELIDTYSYASLPMPKVHYLISKSLVLHSGCKLKLPRFAEIKLMTGSNCVMVRNEMKEDYGERAASKLFSYLDYYSPDFPCENIAIEGGIWNFNNKEQHPNPIGSNYELEGYSGFGMLFYNVKNLTLENLTLKDPINFAVNMDTVSYFNIHDITFDYNDGNRYQSNMDGLHIDGHSHHGRITGLFGTCYDDIVALNAHEGSCGPISDVTISGIYTSESYSAVRLLTASPRCPISNIHISDVHGTFYHFGIGLMKYYDTGEFGMLENGTIDNVYASHSSRDKVKFYLVHDYRKYGIIDVGDWVKVKNLKISNVHRKETVDATPTIWCFEGTTIENLILDNITSENLTGTVTMPICEINSEVENLVATNLREDGKNIYLN